MGSREAVPELSPPDSLSRLLPVTPPKGLGAFGLRGLTLKSLLLQRVNNVQGGSLLTFPSWGCREEFTTFPPRPPQVFFRDSRGSYGGKGLVMLTPSRYLFPHSGLCSMRWYSDSATKYHQGSYKLGPSRVPRPCPGSCRAVLLAGDAP